MDTDEVDEECMLGPRLGDTNTVYWRHSTSTPENQFLVSISREK